MDRSRRHLFTGRTTANTPFRPPWSAAEAVFVLCCTRCDDCIRSCPTGLLVRGGGGFPEADFGRSSCTFCRDCLQACTTGALAPVGETAPWSFVIEIAPSCLALSQVECRVCGDACDAAAIRFRPKPGGVARPEVFDAACTGCGACIAPCPEGAIRRIERAPSSTENRTLEWV